MNLQFVTRGMSNPKGKPKVFFACHPEDQSEAFPLIFQDILAAANCAVWYDADRKSPQEPTEELEELLREMQMLVLAVTSRFIHERNQAKDQALPIALKEHIPVLPIMLENGLENDFNTICAEIQVISKYVTDPTATPYQEKLQSFLDSVLVGDELADKVRMAFDAYVFLSYRKKDRRHAQRLMRLIHDNKQFRDIAIWYDEYLTPGEGFNEAIREAFEKSSLFAMAVTPHLEEAGNYVMGMEYPMARDRKNKDERFEIVPVEMYGPEDGETGKEWRIDQSKSKGKAFKYEEIRDMQDEHRPQEMNQSFLEALSRIAKRDNDDSARHRFFIGLAYLNGIDVEIHPEKALELLTAAAEDDSPCMEATAKLAEMYLYGEGVEPDKKTAIFWQTKLSEQYSEAYEAHHNPDEHKGYGTACFKALCRLSDMQREAGLFQEAMETARRALAFCESLGQEVGTREQERDRALVVNRIGNLYLESGDYFLSEEWFLEAEKIYEKHAHEIGTHRALRDLSVSRERLGDIARKKKDLENAECYYQKTKEIRERLLETDHSANARRDYSVILTKLGNIKKKQKDYEHANEYYNRAMEIDKMLAEEIKSSQALDDLGVSLVKIGDILKSEKRMTQAENHYCRACEIFEDNAKKTGSMFFMDHLAGGKEKLASTDKKLGKITEAKTLYEEAVVLRERLYEDRNTATAAHALATAYYNCGLLLEDENIIRKACNMWEKLSIHHPEYMEYRKMAEKQLASDK